MGEDFDSFSSKMISPEAEALIKYSTENIFNKSTIGRSVDGSFKILSEGIPAYKYMNMNDMKAVATYLKSKGYPVVYKIIGGKESKYVDAKDTLLKFAYTHDIEGVRKLLKEFKVDSDLVNSTKFDKPAEYDENFADYYEDPSDSIGPSYKNTLMKLSRYITDIIELRNDTGFVYKYNNLAPANERISIDKSPKLSTDLLNELNRVNKGAGAIRVLGQMLGINQSIKADPEALNKYFENLEVYYNTRMVETKINDKDNFDKITSDVNSLDLEYYKDIVYNGFNARRFGLDDNYRKVAVDLFDHLKYDINIFDVIANSLHFFEMYKAAIYAESAINNSSKKLRITNKIIDKVRSMGVIPMLKSEGIESNYKGNLPKNIYTRISNMATDVINVKFFDEADIKVKLRKGDTEYDSTLKPDEILSESRQVQLHTYSGRRSFVEWFENKVIPDLKNGLIKNNEGIYNENPSEELLSNEFIKSLRLIIDEDRNTKTRYVKYTLPIKMIQAKTLDEKMMFDTYAEHFRNLGNVVYDGQSIVDLFYLYNLITNGNVVNNDSLTRIFESNFNYVLETSVIKTHLRYIGDLDYNEAGDQYEYLNYLTPEVLLSYGIFSDITADELSNSTKKQLNLVRKATRNPFGVFEYSYFRGVTDALGNFSYNGIETNKSLIKKYINTIDVNNSLSNRLTIDDFKNKVISNLISYKIKCE